MKSVGVARKIHGCLIPISVVSILPATLILLKIYFPDNSEAIQNAQNTDGLKFISAILAAKAYRAESLGKPLVYPRNSLVVYSFKSEDTDVNWDSAGRRYHYGCPKEWLATAKEGVRFVVLVSRDEKSLKTIGYYNGHPMEPAWSMTWNVQFVDLASQRIVARETIVKSDPRIRGDFLDESHSDDPSKDEVVDTVRKVVRFAQ